MAHVGAGGNWRFQANASPLLAARPTRLGAAMEARADQKPREKLLLYAMVFALAPERCLEIGVRWGGGARLIHAALADLGRGVYVGVDPQPELEFDWGTIADRCTLVKGFSPAALGEASGVAGGAFDFVFVDGEHTEQGASADLRGVLGVTEPGAVVLCHDACHEGVERAIGAALREGGYLDCGLIAGTRLDGAFVDVRDGQEKKKTSYGGVRMLRRV